jgi:predicted phage baseplate assembly protein
VYVGTGTYNPIDQTPVYVKWQRVDNFIDSTSESGHYIVSVDENDNMKITFGDGIAGMKPTKEVMAVYRVGGGVIGNIGANTITEMEQTLAVVESTFNPDEAYILGEEKEGIEEAKVKSVAHARTLYRAVTEPDFEDLGLANLDVLKVKAIYNAGTNTVHVYLLPKTVVEFTEGQLATCLAFYNERKLLGINVAVHNPVYVEFNPKLVVKVLPAYINDTTRIRTELDAMLRSEFFAQGYFGFGQSFVASEALAGLMSIKGIKSVYFYETDGVTPILDVDVEDNEILTLSASFSKDTSISFA